MPSMARRRSTATASGTPARRIAIGSVPVYSAVSAISVVEAVIAVLLGRSEAMVAVGRVSRRVRTELGFLALPVGFQGRLVATGAAGVGLLVEALEHRLRLVGVGAGVGVPGLGPKLEVKGLSDHVEDRLLGRADGPLGVAQDLAGDGLGLLHQVLV